MYQITIEVKTKEIAQDLRDTIYKMLSEKHKKTIGFHKIKENEIIR